MLQSIVNFIQAVVGAISSTITGLINILSFVFSGSTILLSVIAFLPAIVASFATMTIVVLIIKFVIGRDN